MENSEKKQHSVTIIERKGGNVTGTNEVLSFSESELLLLTNAGKLRIMGKSLKISSFNNSAATLSFSGEVNELKYQTAQKPILSKIFK